MIFENAEVRTATGGKAATREGRFPGRRREKDDLPGKWENKTAAKIRLLKKPEHFYPVGAPMPWYGNILREDERPRNRIPIYLVRTVPDDCCYRRGT